MRWILDTNPGLFASAPLLILLIVNPLPYKWYFDNEMNEIL